MRFITCRLPDGVEDPAILSADGRQVWPLSWLGLSYETLSDAIPFLTMSKYFCCIGIFKSTHVGRCAIITIMNISDISKNNLSYS